MPDQPDPASSGGAPFTPSPVPGPPPGNPSTVDQEATGEPVPPVLTAADLPARVGRYRIEGEIARGGMGAVLRAHDPEFDRTLALKILLDRLRGSSELERRFLEEARLTARLQHPGVPPVHDRGRLPDGRPFFAMKLVMGRTLADLLRRRPSPAHDLPKFLHTFEQICQTLGYAHAQGIIHRDLKPGNVMVGEFGEVQVMDWGLAKALRPPPGSGRRGADEQAADADTDPGLTEETPESYTQAGQLLGTPAYMAPEQARGEIDNLDERCDVFGLGAILCVILTGQPPFRGPTAYQVAWQAMAGDVDEAVARLDACGADPELARLAKDCLAPLKEDRPRDAGAVARAAASYQEAVRERLRLSELERARAEVKAREARRRWRITLGLAASILVSAGLAVGGWLWFRSQDEAIQRQADERRAERARQEAGVGKALQEVAALMDRFRWAEARAVLAQADSLLGKDGPGDLRQRLRRAAADLKLADDLDKAALAAATYVEFRHDSARADRRFWDTFAGARLVRAEGEAPEAVADRIRGSAIRTRLVAALEEWAYQAREADQYGARWRWLLEIARRAGDADAWHQRFRDPAAWSRPKTLQQLAQQAVGRRLAPQTVRVLGQLLPQAASTEFLRAAVRQYPDDFWINFTLGGQLVWSQPEEALGYCRAALAVRRDHSGPYLAMVQALLRQRKFEEARALCEQVLQRDPDDPCANLASSGLLHQQGRLGEAVVACRRALALDPQSALARAHLGLLLLDQGKLDEAEVSLRQALSLGYAFRHAHAVLGIVLERKGRMEEAVLHYRRVCDLAPRDAQGHGYLANALRVMGRTDEALTAYRKAIPLDSLVPGIHRDMGDRLREWGRPREAERAYRRAVALEPGDVVAHHGLGNALFDQGRPRESEAAFRRGVEAAPNNANIHDGLGFVLDRQGRLDEAEAEYRKAAALDPKYARAPFNLGDLLARQGRPDEALAQFRRATEIDPRYAEAHWRLGLHLRDKGRLDAAIAAFRKVDQLDIKHKLCHYELGLILRKRHRFAEAAAAFRRAVAIDPDYAEAHCSLGLALDDDGRYEQAVPALRRGHELGSRRKDWTYASADWLANAERRAALDRRVSAILQGKDRPKDGEDLKALAVFCAFTKRHMAAAARLWSKAFSDDPKLAHHAENRYQAARTAVQASTGAGRDAAGLKGEQRADLRRQALAWLRTELGICVLSAALSGKRAAALVYTELGVWEKDRALAPVRDPEALKKLAADERAAWTKLWADLRALRARFRPPPQGGAVPPITSADHPASRMP